MIGEDESGYRPSANMFLGGSKDTHGWGKDAVNWYCEAHDTRTNMEPGPIIVIPITSIKMATISRGYPLGDAMGGDGQLVAGRVELITEDNQRWSTRLVYQRD